MVSTHGTFIAFASDETNLVGELNQVDERDVFVAEIEIQGGVRITRASEAGEPPQITEANDNSLNPDVLWVNSKLVVGFESDATNLVANDGNDARDVFRRQYPINRFERGDANQDQGVDLSDPVFVLNYLFLGGSKPECLDAADLDDSGGINISDPIYLLNFLFIGGPAPPSPYPQCGFDPTSDDLSCEKRAPGCP